MIKKVILNLDMSKAPGPDCIPVLVVKNRELELSYMLGELFNKCLKESYFPDCWKVSSVVLVFKNVGERSATKIRYLALFFLFSVVVGFEWFWMESHYKNIQIMLEFLKGLFLVLHFSCCILMTFLMMLSIILLSMLMILLSILTVIRHLICGNNLNWLLNLNLIYKILSTGVRSGLLISMLENSAGFV